MLLNNLIIDAHGIRSQDVQQKRPILNQLSSTHRDVTAGFIVFIYVARELYCISVSPGFIRLLLELLPKMPDCKSAFVKDCNACYIVFRCVFTINLQQQVKVVKKWLFKKKIIKYQMLLVPVKIKALF